MRLSTFLCRVGGPACRQIEVKMFMAEAFAGMGDEDLLFQLPDDIEGPIVVDPSFVADRLSEILEDEDLQRYIL